MSASYTLHVAPYAAPGDADALDRADLVRDGFAWWAFIAPPLWFLAHRHWLLGLAVGLVLAGFWAGLWALGLPAGVRTILNTLLWLLVALEASSLRRWDYARQGRPAVDVVFAANEAEAETKSFARWLEPALARGAVVAPVPAMPAAYPRAAGPWGAEPQVIGLFPDAERRR